MNIKSKITKLHYGKDKNLLFYILRFCSLFYFIAVFLKNFLYDENILKPKRVNADVISVGNLTTGGVGKTPVVAEIAKYFVNKGEKPAIVSRGYGGKLNNKDVNVVSDGINLYYNAEMAGDEPYWLAVNLNMCAVLTCADRYKACKYATENLGVTKIILDDGFQHRKLFRDKDIVLIDSEKKFGNNCVLPAGPLREGANNIKRASKIVVMSKNTEHKNAELFAEELKQKTKKEVLLCKVEPDYAYNIMSGEHLQKKENVTAISAIGQPEQFYNFLEMDYNIKEKITFDDHHLYAENDIKDIDGIIVTTEKDAVKLALLNNANIYALKLKTNIDVEKLIEN